MSEEYYAGKGCDCYAYSEHECCCEGVDWTAPEVYDLEKENAELKLDVKELAEGFSDALDILDTYANINLVNNSDYSGFRKTKRTLANKHLKDQ